jgi:2-polyprenyl-6-methoxyphenol hydroxylase-like FAD-dependent oxidoreductase
VFEPPVSAEEGKGRPIDRTWLRWLMMKGIEDAIVYEKEFSGYEICDDDVKVSFSDGSMVKGAFLVGADGLKIRVRKQLQSKRRLLHLERQVLWGRTLLTESLAERLEANFFQWFMAVDKEKNVQVVVEAMSWSKGRKQMGGNDMPDIQNYIYFALCSEAEAGQKLPKTSDERKEFLSEVTKDWHPALQLIFSEASHDLSTCVLILSSKPDIEIHSSEHPYQVTLLGDAAHTMSPKGGSGGNAAILNAVDLAENIYKHGIKQDAMRKYESRMADRAKEMIEHSFKGGQKFWKGKKWLEYQETDI